MVGLLVEVPVQAGIYIEGRVVSYDEFLGVIGPRPAKLLLRQKNDLSGCL